MSRDYGRLGGGGRRSGSAIWQWMIIGGILGFGCAAVAFLALLVTGQIQLDPSGLNQVTPTAIVQVVTATADPNEPTITPVIITATSEPQPTQPAEVIIPSSTPPQMDEPTPTEEIPAPTQEATTTTDTTAGTGDTTGDTSNTTDTTTNTGTGTDTGTTGTRNLTGGGVPAELEGLGSILLPVQGGAFIMGTNPQEVSASVRICQENGGTCDTVDAQDSIPAHSVTLADFSIERTEVSLRQYVVFLNYLKTTGVDHTNGCNGQSCVETKVENLDTNIGYDTNLYTVEPDFVGEMPVTFVTWYGADAYCKALGRRLPTEAEWEYTARGPGNNVYPWGNDLIVENASTSRSLNAEGTQLGLQPVESFTTVASPFGTLNQAGNVGEWVADWYGLYSPDAAVNPTGPAAGTEKVIRGGNYAYNPFFARTMHRLHAPPGQESPIVGFRCAADAQTPAGTLGTNNTVPGSIGSVTLDAPAVQGTPDPANLGVIGSSTEPVGAAPTLGTGPTPPALPPGG